MCPPVAHHRATTPSCSCGCGRLSKVTLSAKEVVEGYAPGPYAFTCGLRARGAAEWRPTTAADPKTPLQEVGVLLGMTVSSDKRMSSSVRRWVASLAYLEAAGPSISRDVAAATGQKANGVGRSLRAMSEQGLVEQAWSAKSKCHRWTLLGDGLALLRRIEREGLVPEAIQCGRDAAVLAAK